MKKNRLFLIMLLMLASITSLMAQQVSVSDAMAKAKAFLQINAPHRAPSASTAATSQLQLAYTCQNSSDQKVCYYVFNRGTNGGFIIMGGDEVAEEVLAYTDNGNFDFTTIPNNFKWWLSQYQQQITSAMTYAETHPEAAAKAKAKAKAARRVVTPSRVDITPLVTTQWGQDEPYNNAIPSLGDGYDPLVTGCVATAMAQIMKYHNYPAKGLGFHSYKQSYDTGSGTITKTFSADFANTTYDWANMTNTYKSSSTQAQKDAVATLMYHCGVSVDMRYGTEGSSAYNNTPAPAFIDYFRYNKAIRYLYRKHYSDDAWERMIYNELANKRPVLYSGQAAKKGGHAFVCDGYKVSDDTYHMNWGWDGYCDCYVKLTGTGAIKPGGTGTDGDDEQDAFNLSQDVTLNIIPQEGGYETPIVYNNKNTISLQENSTTISTFPYNHNHGTSKTLTLTENLCNISKSLTAFNIGVKAIETTTGYEYIFNTSQPVKTYLGDHSISFDINDIPRNGTYQLTMVVCNTAATNDWYEVGASNSVTLPTITITGANDQEKSNVPFSISDTSVSVSQTLQISHSASYTGNITYTSSNPDVATVSNNGVITGKAEGNAIITAVAEGDTYFNRTEKQFNIEVTPFEKPEMRFSQAPYFEQANPWSGNMVLHMPLYNGTETTFNGDFYAVFDFKGSLCMFTLSLTNLGSGKFYDYKINISALKEVLQSHAGQLLSIKFYADKECTKPFNYPSITYVYQDYLAGDASGDGSLSTDDVTDIKSAVIQNSTASKADFNSDGKVDVIDITKLIDFLKDK